MATSSSAPLSRVTTLLRAPHAGWAAIAADPPSSRIVLLRVAAPLAALAAAGPALGRALFGESVLGTVYRPPLPATLIDFLIAFASILAGLQILALTVDRCAAAFGGTRAFERALVLVTFSAAPLLLAAACTILPGLWWVALAGLYAIPLLVFGLPPMMRCPPDRATAYATVVVVTALVIFLVALALSACLGQLT
jgi:hypothetical protein